MNILILTGRFGMGHMKAAETIRRELLQTGADIHVTTIDFMDYILPELSPLIYRGFGFVVSRCANLYNFLNRAAGKYGGVPLKRTLCHKIDRLISGKIKGKTDVGQADLIISVLPICGQYISAWKAQTHSDIPLYTYVTDITMHEEWLAENTDLYFVGDSATANALISKGVSPEKIIISGIPVGREFQASLPSITQKTAVSHRKNVLIMGGGLGLLPRCDTILRLVDENPQIDATLIAGKNEKLARYVQENYPKIHVIGFTDQVAHYMHQADLLITKPGGITTFEAIASRTPLYIIYPFLTQEQGNASFIEARNIGRVVWSKDTDIVADFQNLIENDQLLTTMKSNMGALTASLQTINPINWYHQKAAIPC